MGAALSKFWGSYPETGSASSPFLSCNTEAAETRGSSSSSSSRTSTKYDVFLSFCGKDTRDTFTSHLYHQLVQQGIQTFLDEEELEKGKQIARNLDEAIAESRIAIPIFSKHYASSKWCLNELVKFMESSTNGQTILPVFYHVSPRDVRKRSGDFGQQFQLLAEKSDKGKVARWKEALRKAGELKGWHIHSGSESKLIQGVVKNIWCELSKISFDVPEGLVGIVSRVTKLLNFLNLESMDVKIVGIWGMGGIGKTTLAGAVFKQFQHKFEGHIFLEDIREASKQPKHIVSLQRRLLSDILKQKFSLINNMNEGKYFIKKFLHKKRVLIVLDNVDNIEQLEALAGRPDWFGPGSRIIITTRDEHMLKVHKVHGVYEVEELDFHQSLHLFSMHAFGKDQPPSNFLKLAEDVVGIAGGLPLALKILGSLLFDKSNPKLWESTLDRLKKIPPKNVEEKLKISYDGLDEYDQKIFLDIACFFNGMDKEYATYIGEGCGFSAEHGLTNLIQKSLVKINDRNELRMHDQLRDMGRHIVWQESPDKPGRRSRLWFHEEVVNILKRKSGTKNVEGIVLKLEGDEVFITEAFEMMSELRLLQIDNVHLEGDFEKLPSELRWLRCKGFPLESIPTGFRLEKLVVLDLSGSRIKQVWNDLDKNKEFQELKALILRKCRDLTETPDFSRLPNLEILNLEGCIKLEELQTSICKLTSLKKLILSGCSNLDKLPDLHGSVEKLEVLKLDDCKLLCRSPDWIGNMRNLTTLSLDGTSITELPDVVGLLEKIEKLNVYRCSNLVKLPDSMGKMRLLRWLCISKTGIVKLPEDFGMLPRLESLSMHGCREFRGFPENFGSLVRLTYLNVSGNSKLAMLPISFSGLSSLERLTASSCSLSEGGVPRDLGKLTSLQWLDLSCNSFCSLPASISTLSRLMGLFLNNCRNLRYLPQLPSSLLNLEVKNCISLETLSDLSKGVGDLNLSNCEKLGEIEGIEKMECGPRLMMSGYSRAAVNSVCKAFGQEWVTCLTFCGSEIPDWFTPAKLNYAASMDEQLGHRYHIGLDFGEVPTRLWNLQQPQKIIGVVLIFVFMNQPGISRITFNVVIKGRVPLTLNIHQNGHQDQICLCHIQDYGSVLMSEMEEGDRIRVKIESERKMEVKKGGMHVIYQGTDEQSAFKRITDFITHSSHNDDDDDDGCKPSSSKRKRFQLLQHDDDDDDDDDGDGGSRVIGRKRYRLQLL